MHGLSGIRRMNGETLSEEDLIAAARSAAAKPTTVIETEQATDKPGTPALVHGN